MKKFFDGYIFISYRTAGAILGALFLFIITASFFIANDLKANQLANIPTPTPTQAPIPTAEPEISKAPVRNKVSYAIINSKLHIKYKGKVYTEESIRNYTTVSLEDPYNHNWSTILEVPPIELGYEWDEIFDFKLLPDGKNFVFVMAWHETNFQGQDYKLFVYNESKPEKVTRVRSFYQKGRNTFNVPRVKQVSNDGKYVAFDMYGCWACESAFPDTMLLSVETLEHKRIGETSFFNWKNDGTYEYKENKVIPCPTITGSGYPCFEDHRNLPLLTGSF